MIRILITLLFFSLSLFAQPSVAVSIAPQKYFTQQVMGEDAKIVVMVPSGAAPDTYAPKPSQLRALKNVSLYFSIGVEFEKNWLERFRAINPTMKIINTTKGIQKRTLQAHHDSHHHHEGLDPHIWLSPKLVMIEAKHICDALIMNDAQNKAKYEKNYQVFLKRLQHLDREIKGILAPLKQRNFIVFHPAFGYFADAYDLHQVAIEKAGKSPTIRQIKQIIDFAKAKDIHTIFVAPQFSQKAAKQIATLSHAKVVTIDPLSPDWESNLRQIAKSFEKAN